MNILINAVSFREGGSVVVLREFLKHAVTQSAHRWIVAVSPSLKDALPEHELIRYVWHEIPGEFVSLLWWYEMTLPGLIREYHADLLFSHTNYLPLRSISCPTLLLVQHAGHYSPVFTESLRSYHPGWTAMVAWRIKRMWVRRSVRQCSRLTLQTQALADDIQRAGDKQASQISVVAHGPGNLDSFAKESRESPQSPLRLGYIGKFGVQKGLTTLLQAVHQMKRDGQTIRLVLTLDETNPDVGRVLEEVRSLGLSDVVDNLGESDAQGVRDALDTIDVFVFPSLCESWGFPLVEAMSRGVPVVAADTPVNREVAGNAACYFKPGSSRGLVEKVVELVEDPVAYKNASEQSMEQAGRYDWRVTVRQLLDVIDKTVQEAASGKRVLTQEHYDRHPFDFMTEEDERNIVALQPVPFREFVATQVRSGMQVIDVGCGPGRATLYFCHLKIPFIALDLSRSSIGLARRRAPGPYIQASNLSLPLMDGSMDVVVSDGVIHHTPDPRRAFAENARILKSGGVMYLGVYRKGGYYDYIYNLLGPAVRWIERYSVGRLLLHLTLIPIYFLVHLIKSGGSRTWRGARNFFYDYIVTPQACFFSLRDIELWAEEEGMSLERYYPRIGNVHAFVLRKL